MEMQNVQPKNGPKEDWIKLGISIEFLNYVFAYNMEINVFIISLQFNLLHHG